MPATRHLPLRLTAALGLLLAAPAFARPADPEGWVAVRSPHFVIYTDASPERGGEIAASLERFRAVFAQLAPRIELVSPAPTKILAFRDAASYAPYKSGRDSRGSRVLGQFLSHPDGNYLTLDAGTRLVGAYAVIYHEYVHYFVRHNFPGVPRWFNEGLAEYYSTFATDGEYAYVGRPVERHVAWLERHGELALGEVLAATGGPAAGHRSSGREAARFYAVSWALVHYLLSGEAERLERAADFFLLLAAGEDPEEAFEEAFDVRLGALAEELERYLRSGDLPEAAIPLGRLPVPRITYRPAPPADVLFHLGDLLAHMRRTADAERHFQTALDRDAEHPEVHAGLALVRDLEGRVDEAEVLHRDALRLGSADPLTYLLYGRHLLSRLRGGEEADRPALAALARAALSQAVELDAGYGEAWALLGLAHLYGDADLTAGVRAFARARELLPDRLDLIFHLAQLEVRNGRPERADALVAELAGRGATELAEQARREVERLKLLRAAEAALEREEIDEGLRLFDEAISLTVDPRRREEMEGKLLELQERLGDRP
jgi:tetratricopeptide (TPR) repeat protein